MISTLAVAAAVAAAAPAWGVTLEFAASRDTTLVENGTGALSNGAGSYLFVGRVGTPSDSVRRGLIYFDLSAIPTGSTINSVELSLQMSRTPPLAGTHEITLHRVLADWGEGASRGPGPPQGEGAGGTSMDDDATWVHTFFNTGTWSTPGGDFEATASASGSVGGIELYTWDDGGLVDDVQAWVDGTLANYGWLLMGNESAPRTAKRFDTRTGPIPPSLVVDYTPAMAPEPAAALLLALALGTLARRRSASR